MYSSFCMKIQQKWYKLLKYHWLEFANSIRPFIQRARIATGDIAATHAHALACYSLC
jgi:hypothetical protein